MLLRRFLFVVPTVMGLLTFYFRFDFFYYWIWICGGMTCTSAILLYNFPVLARITHTRPIYFEELRDRTALDERMKSSFQRQFTIWNGIITSLFIGALSDYIFFRLQFADSWFSVMAALGGAGSLFASARHVGGSILLSFFQQRKIRRLSHSTSKASMLTEVELEQIEEYEKPKDEEAINV